MERKQRFSLRKYKVGLASVLIGTIFLGGVLTTGVVHADVEPGTEVTASDTANPVTSQDVKDAKEASDTAETAVTTQEGVVNQAQADQTIKETAVEDLNKKITAAGNVDQDLAKAQTEKETLDNQLTTATSEQADAAKTVSEKQSAEQAAQVDKTAKDQAVAAKETAKKEADVAVKTATDEKATADRALADKTAEKNQADATAKTAADNLTTKEKELAAAQAALEKLKEDNASSAAQLEAAQKEVATKQKAVDTAQGEVATAQAGVDKLEKEEPFPYPTEFKTTSEWIEAFKNLVKAINNTKPVKPEILKNAPKDSEGNYILYAIGNKLTPESQAIKEAKDEYESLYKRWSETKENFANAENPIPEIVEAWKVLSAETRYGDATKGEDPNKKYFLIDDRAEKAYKEYIASINAQFINSQDYLFTNPSDVEKVIYVEFSQDSATSYLTKPKKPSTEGGVIEVYHIPAKSGIKVNADTHIASNTIQRLYDPNNLPDDLLMDLNQYFETLLNSLRRQLDLPEIRLNKNNIAFAKDVARVVVRDTYVHPPKKGVLNHYAKGISEVAGERGLKEIDKAKIEEDPGSQPYENLGLQAFDSDFISKDELFKTVAEHMGGFFFEGYQGYGHAFGLSGSSNMGIAFSLNYNDNSFMHVKKDEYGKPMKNEKGEDIEEAHSSPRLKQDGTFELDSKGNPLIMDSNGKPIPDNELKLHVLSVNKNQLVDPVKAGGTFEELYGPDSKDNVAAPVYRTKEVIAADLQKAKKVLVAKQATLTTATADLQKAQAALNNAEPVSTEEAQKRVDDLTAEKAQLEKEKQVANQKVTDLVAELVTLDATAKQVANQLTAAKNQQATAQKALSDAQAQAQAAATALNQAQAAVQTAQTDLANKQTIVKDLNNQVATKTAEIADLTSKSQELADLQNQLAQAQAALENAKQKVQTETATLVQRRQQATAAKQHYDELLAKYIRANGARTEEADVDFATEYSADDTADFGSRVTTQPGKKGKKVTTIKYNVNPDTGELTEVSREPTVTEQPTNAQVKVGVKPKITTQVLPFATTYEANPEAAANTKETATEGQDGQVTTTIRYELNTDTGEVKELTPEVERKEAVNELIKVGTKSDTTREVIARKVTYKEDPTVQAGQQTVETEGSDGTKVSTVAYDLDTTNGVATAKSPVETITAPVDKVVKVGTADKVERTEIDFTTTYTADPDRPANDRSEQGGVKGSKVTTTKYTLNTQTGQVTPETPTTVETKPVDKIVIVGTKAKVEVITAPIVVTYVEDKEAKAGSQVTADEGKAATTTKTTTYTLNAQDGTVSASDKTVVEDGKPKVVKVGTKQTVDVKTSPIEKTYVEDENAELNSKRTVKQGTAKVTATITTYTLNVQDGTVTPTTRTEVTEGTPDEIAVGTKPTTTTKEVEFGTDYVADANLDFGATTVRTEGEKGEDTVTTTYKLEGDHAKKDSETTVRTKAPVTQVIVVGIKPTEVKTPVPFVTEYKADETLAYGETSTETEGIAGETTVTTTYTVNPDGSTTAHVGEPVQTQAPVAKVVKVGTKSSTSTNDIAYTTIYEADASRDLNTTSVKTQGEKGVETTTTTYKLEGDKAVVDQVTTAVTKEPVTQVIAVGTKPTVVTEEVAFGTDYVADDNLAYGETTEVAGKVGTKAITTTYKLDGSKAVADKTSEAIIVQPVNKIVKVGTKPSTSTKDIAYATTYEADASRDLNTTAVKTQGEKGAETTTTTYKLEGDKAVVNQVTTAITKQPVAEVVQVGTKPTVVTEDVPFGTDYVADANLDYGKTTVRTAGVKGTKLTTTTYKLDGSKAVVDKVTTMQMTAPIAEVIAVGNVQTTTQPIAIVTRQVNDANLEAGQTRVVEEGKAGVLTTVTTYSVNPTTGALENGQAKTTETVKMVERVVAVGTKVSPVQTTRRVEVRTEVLPFTTERRETAELAKGVEREVQVGVNGSYKVVRDDVYEGDKLVKTGIEFETDRIAPVTRIIEVGTKVSPVQTTRRVEVRTEVLPFTTERRETAELAKGVEREVQVGVNGSYKVVRDDVYEGDKLVKTGIEFETDRIEPVTRIIEVGTKESVVPTQTTRRVEVRTEVLPFTTERRENSALAKGVEREVQSGVNGSYKVVRDDVYEGDKLVKTGSEYTVDRITPVARIIEVGTKEVEIPVQTTRRVEVRTEMIPFTTERRENSALDKGVEREVQAGVNGSYKVVRDDVYEGDKLVKTGIEFETDRIEPVTRIIEVGTKESVVPTQTTRRVEVRTEVLPFTTERRETAELAKGVEREVQSGVNGSYKVVRDDVYEGDKLVKTGSEYTVDRIAPVTRIIEVGTKEAEVPTPTQPITSTIPTTVRPGTPEEIKQLEDLKEQLKKDVAQSNLSQVDKDRFLNLIDQAVAKDQLTTQVNNRQVTVSLDNSQLQAARLVVRELQGAEAREVATTVESQLDNQTVVTSYDIQLMDKNNQVVSNNGEQRAVTIAIAKSDDETLSVYYVNGDQLEEMPSIYQNGQLTFFTDHFSVYSIVRTAQAKGNTNPTPTQTSVDVAGPESEKTARPVPVQASRPTQAMLPNTGENEQETGQLTALGAGLLSLLGLSWVKRQKKDRA